MHIAASSGITTVIKYLLENGADPAIKGESKNARPYDLSLNKDTRDEFRRYMALNMEKWDYKSANIPAPLTEEMERKQRENDLERRKKERESKKARKKKKVPETIEEPVAVATKKISLMSLSKTEKQYIGLTPEQRQALDREKRYRTT